MTPYGIVVHGGAGSPEEFSDGCKAACEAAFGLLEAERSALDAAVLAVRILEDDERFNAGFGSALRIDGKTVEMDAAVMDSLGRIGIVINVRDIKNPILLARAVLDTPHAALAGRGAEEYGKEVGVEFRDMVSEKAIKKYNELKRAVNEGLYPFWRRFLPDTVGAAALDKSGIFAVASSTGGAPPMLVGRVGDTPMPGCGFYCGESGAVAVTGLGEEIIKKMPAKLVYDLIASGEDANEACDKGIKLFPDDIRTGIVAVSKYGHAAVSSKGMAYHALWKA